MSSQQRLQVWKGLRKSTSGGLTKNDLKKNKRGKLVSKRKSNQASSQNNLGSWLREKGKHISKEDMLRSKKEPPKKEVKKAVSPPPKKTVRQILQAKIAQRLAEKNKKKKPKINKPQSKKPKVKRKIMRTEIDTDKGKAKSNINPLTKQEKEKNLTTTVSLDNIKRRRLRPRKRVSYVGQM